VLKRPHASNTQELTLIDIASGFLHLAAKSPGGGVVGV
jgi:hypothetical protein